jgi:hypothetical protein
MAMGRQALQRQIQMSIPKLGFKRLAEHDQDALVQSYVNTVQVQGERFDNCFVALENLLVSADENGAYGSAPKNGEHTPADFHEHVRKFFDAVSNLDAPVEDSSDDEDFSYKLSTSVESFASVSLEGVKETLASVWAAIKRALAYLWGKLGEFFDAVVTGAETLRIQADYIKSSIAQYNGTTVFEPMTALGSEVYTVAVDGVPPADGQAIIHSLDNLRVQAAAVYTAYCPMLDSVGASITSAMKTSWSENGGEERWLYALNQAAVGYDIRKVAEKIPKLSAYNDSRFSYGIVKAGSPLPGSRSLLFVDTLTGLPNETSEVERAVKLQSSGIHMSRITMRQGPPLPFMLKTMPSHAVLDIADEVLKLLTLVTDFTSHKYMAKYKVHADALKTVTDRVHAGDNSPQEIVHHGLLYNEAYARWASDPLAGLTPHILYVCRGALGVCKKTLRNYERSKRSAQSAK